MNQLFSVCFCTEQRQLFWKQHREWQLRWRYFHHPLCWSLEESVASQHGLSSQLSRRIQPRRGLSPLQVCAKMMLVNLQCQNFKVSILQGYRIKFPNACKVHALPAAVAMQVLWMGVKITIHDACLFILQEWCGQSLKHMDFTVLIPDHSTLT